MALYNLVRVTTATVGVGAVTLGAAVPGFLDFLTGNVPDGATVSYGIREGNNSETGRGVYTLGTQNLTRVPNASTNGGAAIVLAGAAELFITGLAEDFVTNGDAHDHTGGDGAQINHTTLSNIGTNTHVQIDTHIADVLTNPHNVTAAQVGAPALVNPSVVNNFVAFSNITGAQKDSGFDDTDFLKVLNNLSDLNNVATARTNLGLVAGGTGDIWVEKVGDAMTGALTIGGTADTTQLSVTGHTTQTGTVGSFKRNDGATNTQGLTLTVGANSTGTPAAGFGVTQNFTLESSTTADQLAAKIDVQWATATHASRAARMTLSVYDTAAREGIRIEGSGTAPMLGFYGTTATAQAISTMPLGTVLSLLGLRAAGVSYFNGNYSLYYQNIAYAATINWNTALGAFAGVTLTGNTIIANPTNLNAGGYYTLRIVQDSTGGRTITSWGSNFLWDGGRLPVLTTIPNGSDIFEFFCDGTYLYGVAGIEDYFAVSYEDEPLFVNDEAVFL